MKNTKRTVNKDKKSINDFLYAFGLKGTESSDNIIESPMDFAYAMGVSRYLGHTPEKKPETIIVPVPSKLKYI